MLSKVSLDAAFRQHYLHSDRSDFLFRLAIHALDKHCGMIHGDVSPANVLWFMGSNGMAVGILNDFDTPDEERGAPKHGQKY